MTFNDFIDILLDSIKDSAFIFLIVFAFTVVFSFIEVKIAKRINKSNKVSPLLGSLFGLIPQCGISVIGSDLYIKKHITLGTLIAIFLSCSDEAIPLLIASNKFLAVLILILSKFVIGFIIGFIVDLIIKDKEIVEEHHHHCEHEEEIHTGCCNHHIDDEEESSLHKHFIHPLLHSLKVLLYVFIINILFSLLFTLIGEENIKNFISSNSYLSPILASIIGLIPNCASSIVLSELYVIGSINFGALLAGLLVNSGLGIIYLLKNKDNRIKGLKILLFNFIISIIVGYLANLIISIL